MLAAPLPGSLLGRRRPVPQRLSRPGRAYPADEQHGTPARLAAQPSLSRIRSPTRRALAMAVSAKFTPLMPGKMLVGAIPVARADVAAVDEDVRRGPVRR